MYNWKDIKLKKIFSYNEEYKASFKHFFIKCWRKKYGKVYWWNIYLFLDDKRNGKKLIVPHDTIFLREKGFRDSLAKYLNKNSYDIIRYIFQ